MWNSSTLFKHNLLMRFLLTQYNSQIAIVWPNPSVYTSSDTLTEVYRLSSTHYCNLFLTVLTWVYSGALYFFLHSQLFSFSTHSQCCRWLLLLDFPLSLVSLPHLVLATPTARQDGSHFTILTTHMKRLWARDWHSSWNSC